MRRAAVGSGEVVVVVNHLSALLPADVAGGGRDQVELVGGRHHHWDGAVDRGANESVLVLQ